MKNSKVATVESNKIPQVKEILFDQFKQQRWDIVRVDKTGVEAKSKNTKRIFLMREIEWDDRCSWWTFRNEKKEYKVWLENIPAEDALNKKGTWELAVNVPMTQSTAQAIEKLLKQEHPQVDFAVSIGKPSSYFF